MQCIIVYFKQNNITLKQQLIKYIYFSEHFTYWVMDGIILLVFTND